MDITSDTEFDKKLDNALLAGADISDVNNILARTGRPTFTNETNPLEQSEVQEENPLETSLQNTNEFSRTAATVRGAAIALSNGQDPVDFYNRMITNDPEIISNDMVATAKEVGRQAVVMATERMAIEQEVIDIQNSVDLINQQTEAYDDPVLGKYRAFAMQLEGAELLPPDVIDGIAANTAISDMITEEWDKMSKGKVFADIVGLVLVPDTAYNSAKVLKEFFPDSSFIERYWDSEEAVIAVRSLVKSLPPKQKVELAQKVRDLYYEVDDNKLQNIFMMLDLFDPSDAGLFGSKETDIEVDHFFDKASVATLGAGVMLRLNRLRKLGNIAKIAARAQNESVAGQVSYMATQSAEVRTAVGIDRIEAAAAADPHTSLMKKLMDGVPEDYAVVINKQWENIDARIAEATRIDEFKLPLTELEKTNKAKLAAERLESYNGIQDVTYTITKSGVDLNFNVVDSVSGKVVGKNKQPLSIPFTVNDITGGFQADSITFVGEMGKAVLSPNFLFNKDRNLLLQNMERIGFASDKIKAQLNSTLLAATSKLDKTQLTSVQNLLRKGDAESRTFSYKEIVHDMGLSEKEFEAYAATRQILDNAFILKNKELRTKLVVQGLKEVNVKDSVVIAKPYDTTAQARAAYRGNPGKIYIEDTGKILTDPDKIEEYYSQGYFLSSTRKTEEFFTIGETNYQWALVKRNNIKELPVNVMDRKEGYVPRAYKDAAYFVKREDIVKVDGGERTVKKLNTLRYFDNPSDAEKYIDILEEEASLNNVAFNRNSYRVLGDREIPAEILDEDYINAFGGLYTSARRTEGPLKFGLPGDEGGLVAVFESMQNYFANIGNRLPISEYRLGIQERWLNHAKHTGYLSREYNGSFTDAVGLLSVGSRDPRGLSFLEKAHEQIQHMSRIPTKEEVRWAGLVQEAGSRIDAIPGGNRVSKYVYNLQHTGPIDALRSATFHILLGSFNISQLVVQASGASVALSINPVSAVKSLPRAFAYRTLDLIKDPSARVAAAKHLEKSVGDGFAKEYELWSKSGLYESVIKSSSDYQALANGLPVDAGLIRRLWDKNTIFYKEGELVNSRISFATAVEHWKDTHKGQKITDDVLSDIVARTEQYKLNMSNANKATVQKNWLRLLTQFQAVNARYLEALGGNYFTKAEKAKLFFGQTALFGAASVPFFESSLSNLLAGLFTSEDAALSDMSNEELTAIRQGFVGYTFSQVLGVEADIGGRIALGNDFLDGLLREITEPTEAYKIFFGPSWTTIDRSLDVVNSLYAAASGIGHSKSVSEQEILFAGEVVAEALLDLPSTSRNALKAYYLDKFGYFKNNDGQPIFLANPNLQTEVALALGFQPQDVVDYYDIGKINRSRKLAVDSAADMITSVYHKIATGEDSDREAFVFAANAIIGSIDNRKDRIDIMRKVQDSIRQGRSKKAREIMEVLRNINTELVDNTAKFIPTINERLQRGQEQ